MAEQGELGEGWRKTGKCEAVSSALITVICTLSAVLDGSLQYRALVAACMVAAVCLAQYVPQAIMSVTVTTSWNVTYQLYCASSKGSYAGSGCSLLLIGLEPGGEIDWRWDHVRRERA